MPDGGKRCLYYFLDGLLCAAPDNGLYTRSCSGVRWSVIVVVLAEALYARFKTCFVVPLDPSIFFCSIMIA